MSDRPVPRRMIPRIDVQEATIISPSSACPARVLMRCTMSSPSLPQDAAQFPAWLRDFCFQDLGVRKECVTPEADFVHDLGMDSLGFVLLVLELEEQFDIDIPDAAADQIHTVGDAIACVQ